MEGLDPRLHAFRPDLADKALEGQVEVPRFVSGITRQVMAAVAPVRRGPSSDAMVLTEALRGETAEVFETTEEGWAWVQLSADRYVGWISADALQSPRGEPTHRVSALRTLVFPGPDIKQPPLAALPMGALVTVKDEAEDRNARYALIEPAGAIVVQHLAPRDAAERDWTAVVERFIGVPYLWGGKTSLGIDCSGLVQVALQACGVRAPRDSDMQEATLGTALSLERGISELRRGDLVFWSGHVGIMQDAFMLLHANAHHMAVAVEPLAEAIERVAARGGTLSSVRRIGGR